MLGPLVEPEAVVVALVVFPVCAHVVQKFSLAKRLQDGRNVRVGARGVAVRIVGAVTAVGPVERVSILSVSNLARNIPQSVERPAIHWPSDGVCVPELRLQELSTRRIEAAQVLHHCRVVAAQLGHRARLQSGEIPQHLLA